MEVFFDKGILSGTKTKKWRNGQIREEEYWSGGKFKGRRLWDAEGRLTREEMVPED
jgi:antitoxin component YwqK of YwqJK toxin-antitoxin module